jgi:hypothetical protein
VAGHIFISYSHHDHAYTARLAAYLRSIDIQPWTDVGIEHGADWAQTIEGNIESCAGFVPLMSIHSRQATWVRNEILLAQRLNKPILPLLLSGTWFFELLNVQGEDVTNAAMPSPAFITRLNALAGPRTRVPTSDDAATGAPLRPDLTVVGQAPMRQQEPAASTAPAVEPAPAPGPPKSDERVRNQPVPASATSSLGGPRADLRRRPRVLTAVGVIAVLAVVIGIGYLVPKLVGGRVTGSPALANSLSHSAGTTQTRTPTPTPSPTPPAPATDFSIFKSSLLRSFATKWATAFPCSVVTSQPLGMVPGSSVFCVVNSNLPGVRSQASKRILVNLGVIQSGYPPRETVDCAGESTYVIPRMDATLRDLSGIKGSRTGYYCESARTVVASYSGPPAGYCTDINWTSADKRLRGDVEECAYFQDEGSSFKPTATMLAYLRTLWRTYE